MESPKQKILKNYILARLGFERGAFLADYIENLTKIVKNYEDAISSGNLSKEFYKKEFTLNGNDAILYYSPDKKIIPNKSLLVLETMNFL